MHWHNLHGKVKDSKVQRLDKMGTYKDIKKAKIQFNWTLYMFEFMSKTKEKWVTEKKSLLIMATKFVFPPFSSLYHNRWIVVELKVF